MRDPRLLRWTLIGLALAFLGLFVVLPLASVFVEAFSKGAGAYLAAIREPETMSAIRLTLLVAAIAVPLNVVFGIAASWLIAKYDFPGKSALITLIDLPFSVSPVISGLIFVLLLGARGIFGPILEAHDIHIIFAVPGIVLATTFVTFPFVARELLPVMQELGNDEEEAALTLGAGSSPRAAPSSRRPAATPASRSRSWPPPRATRCTSRCPSACPRSGCRCCATWARA
jgi:sulfate transport system permease protein